MPELRNVITLIAMQHSPDSIQKVIKCYSNMHREQFDLNSDILRLLSSLSASQKLYS